MVIDKKIKKRLIQLQRRKIDFLKEAPKIIEKEFGISNKQASELIWDWLDAVEYQTTFDMSDDDSLIDEMSKELDAKILAEYKKEKLDFIYDKILKKSSQYADRKKY